jgi:hypothetical protein
MLLLTSFSDWKQTRGLPAAGIFLVGLTGWAILLGVPAAHATATQLHVRYFGCICVVVAGYVNIPIIICKSLLTELLTEADFAAWQSGNTGNQSQRAASLGMLNTLGQCLSLAAAFL